MIRQTTSDDWPLLREVRLRALADAPEAFLETLDRASGFPEEHWRGRATPSDAQACFLREDGAGMVSCFTADDPANVFLVAMWIAPALRGTRAAQGLVQQVIEWAHEHDAARVCLSVEGDNERAARLYEKCGFAETTDQLSWPYEPNEGSRFYVFEL